MGRVRDRVLSYICKVELEREKLGGASSIEIQNCIRNWVDVENGIADFDDVMNESSERLKNVVRNNGRNKQSRSFCFTNGKIT